MAKRADLSLLGKRIWFTTAQAADYCGRHPQTVRKACEAGDLCGSQRRRDGKPLPKARWSIHLDCLTAWIEGQPCPRHEGQN